MLKGFAAAAFLCVTAVAEAEPSPLSGQEISNLVAGATVEIDAPLGFKVRLRYTRDGQVFGETSTALVLILGAASDTGQWWVEPDQLCHKWKIWFNDYPQCFRMTKEGQTFYWRTFDDKTGTAAIVVPAPPVQTAAVTQPSVPEARVTPAPQPESAKPTASTETPRPVPKPVARPEAAKQAAEQSAQKAPATRTASSQAQSSQTDDGVSRERTQSAPAPEPPFMVVNVARGDVLNVRKGPSVDFEVVGALPPGSRGVTVTGACQSRWCPVEHPSARGWVNSTYLAREEPPGAGTDAPLLAADLATPPHDDRAHSDDALTERKVAEFCYGQRHICRKICDLRSRFEDRFDGCPHSCDSRESRCSRTGCYRWTEPEYALAQKFGAHKCTL